MTIDGCLQIWYAMGKMWKNIHLFANIIYVGEMLYVYQRSCCE